ncbi:NADP-dependent 3-hydroxy acid dehydrogenase YdfG [Parasphingorhabdus marina DSM 22363]|uniref:NADP-dependent 3-hydroxy acid dehydrogenase YdfG n=1 Tax=Parasphingorhabdus marina DSM 22363 TaxID=1123272 RepID=A0A1N6FRW8_9SPHN|nr:oxidoreductase [Parasphingorhabdus marina]SIN98059.1 NADP-dependent 3-hydroxy acid dehydrogenase YdfG [Parasphingorhabdus marina DSM 22363]
MIKNFTDRQVPDQRGRTIMVTGANSGIGFETARVLAAKGARVLLGCRSEERAEDAMAVIRKEIPDSDLAFVPLDQASLKSVAAAAKLVGKEKRLDVLVNNAGIMMPPYELTEDGFESQFGVNHLGTFALTALLLPKLQQRKKARIVITSSLAHRSGRIDFNDINAEKRYNAMQRYAMSKLANILHAGELDRRLRAQGSTVSAICCHPGVADTELARHLPFFAQAIMPLARLFLSTSAEGAWSTLAAAAGKGAVGGKYYGPANFGGWTGPATEASRSFRARDEELAEKLWDLSVEMTGIEPAI